MKSGRCTCLVNLRESRTHVSTYLGLKALFWLALSLLLFGGAYAIAELGDTPEAMRALMLIVLGTIIVTNAIWQATGLTRLENLILPRRKPS